MKRGGALHGARIAYETWGTLNAGARQRDPDPHRPVARRARRGQRRRSGAGLVGGDARPGQADRHRSLVRDLRQFAGQLQGLDRPGVGQPGHRRAVPASISPSCRSRTAPTPRPHVVRALGIERLACVIGNSMGGMIALAYLLRHPGIARTHINISGAARALPFSIAIRSLQREAIRLDPHWNDGHYDDAHLPRIGHAHGAQAGRDHLPLGAGMGRPLRPRAARLRPRATTTRSAWSSRSRATSKAHARRFVRRFDPNCYLYLSRSMDWFDIGEYCHGRCGDATTTRWPRWRRSGSTRRWRSACTPTSCSRCSSRSRSPTACAPGGADASFLPLESPQGHDAFLVDIARFGPAVGDFLSRARSAPPRSATRLESTHERCRPARHRFPRPRQADRRARRRDRAGRRARRHRAPLRNALCELIRDHDVQLPDCVLRADQRPLRAPRALPQPDARLQRRRDDLGPGPGHAGARPLRPVVRRRRVGRRARDHAVRAARAATANASASAPPAASRPAPAAPAA